MSHEESDQCADGIDNDQPTSGSGESAGLSLDRRSALKGGAAGFAALGLGGLGTNTVVADHSPANKVAAAGSHMTALDIDKKDGYVSDIGTLLGPLEMKTSSDDKQALAFQPSLESSLHTDVEVKKSKGGGDDSDQSTAKAGVLGWIEVTGDETNGEQMMVGVDGEFYEAPSSASDLVDSEGNLTGDYRRGVVAFNTRDFQLEWDWDDTYLEDNEEEVLSAYLRTRSANAFNWIAPIQGENVVELRGVTYVYADDDKAEAVALVGNRTMVAEPIKLHHEV